MELFIFVAVLGIIIIVLRLVGAWMLRIDEVIKLQKATIKQLVEMNNLLKSKLDE